MRKRLKKLLVGRPEENLKLEVSILKSHLLNLKKVWDNEYHNDIGLEKMLRLFLYSIQFLFPGIYIREIFGRYGSTYKNLAVEFYVLLKTVLPLIYLLTGTYQSPIIIGLTMYLMAETIFYIASVIFVSDVFHKPHSYRRAILLLFLNYNEIVLDFAVIYRGLDLLTKNAVGTIDFIYFSYVTSSTVGFGDIHPATDLGKITAASQSVITLAFIVLFVNFFSSRVEVKGFFKKEDD